MVGALPVAAAQRGGRARRSPATRRSPPPRPRSPRRRRRSSRRRARSIRRSTLRRRVGASRPPRRPAPAAGNQVADSAFNLFSLGPTVELLAGRLRRSRGGRSRRQQALAQSQADQLAAAYLTLTGNVVAQAIAIAGARLRDRRDRGDRRRRREEPRPGAGQVRRRQGGADRRPDRREPARQRPRAAAAAAPAAERRAARALGPARQAPRPSGRRPISSSRRSRCPGELPVRLPVRARPPAPRHPGGRGAAARRQRRGRRRDGAALPVGHAVGLGRA